MMVQKIFEKLHELQGILSEKIEIEREVYDSPKLLSNQEELLARLKRSFIDKNAELEATIERQREVKVLLSEAEISRETAEKNMDAVSTQREYELLEKEIRDFSEKEQQYRKDLQKIDRDIELFEEGQTRDAALIAQQEAELAERKTNIESGLQDKHKRLKELEKTEKRIGKGIDEEILFKFERIIRSKLGVGIVAIKNGVCSGCHMVLPAEFANQVRAMEEVVFCPYCSRILFYDEVEEKEEVEGAFFDDDDMGGLSEFADSDLDAEEEDIDLDDVVSESED